MATEKKDVIFQLGDDDDEASDVVPVMKGALTSKSGKSNGIPIPKKADQAHAGSPSRSGAGQAAELAMSPRTMIR